jgi:hypothetical protein
MVFLPSLKGGLITTVNTCWSKTWLNTRNRSSKGKENHLDI